MMTHALKDGLMLPECKPEYTAASQGLKVMTCALKDRLPIPESKLEYTAWSPFPGEEELDGEENDQIVWQRNLNNLRNISSCCKRGSRVPLS